MNNVGELCETRNLDVKRAATSCESVKQNLVPFSVQADRSFAVGVDHHGAGVANPADLARGGSGKQVMRMTLLLSCYNVV